MISSFDAAGDGRYAKGMGTAQFLGVARYVIRGNQDPGLNAPASEDIDEVPDRLTVYRPGPVFAFNQ